jgi:hypothetical protein
MAMLRAASIASIASTRAQRSPILRFAVPPADLGGTTREHCSDPTKKGGARDDPPAHQHVES